MDHNLRWRISQLLARGGAGALVLIVAACQHPTELRVPLEYRPTEMPHSGANVSQQHTLAVVVNDARTDSTTIGRNAESNPAIPVYAATSSPADFVRDAVGRGLNAAGVQVAAEPAQADRTLRIDLDRFWVEESATYNGTISGPATLSDRGGHSLWRGTVSGSSKRWGASLSPGNYQEAFSNAAADLVQNLIGDPRFVNALNAADVSPPAHKAAPRRKKK